MLKNFWEIRKNRAMTSDKQSPRVKTTWLLSRNWWPLSLISRPKAKSTTRIKLTGSQSISHWIALTIHSKYTMRKSSNNLKRTNLAMKKKTFLMVHYSMNLKSLRRRKIRNQNKKKSKNRRQLAYRSLTWLIDQPTNWLRFNRSKEIDIELDLY